MMRIGLLALTVAFLTVAGTVFADPGDVLVPDAALEAAIEAIIGDDGVPGAVDGNWLVGDGGSSAGPGLNDPDGLTDLGLPADPDDDLEPVIGVTDLTGLEAATELSVLVLAGGDIASLAPIADLPNLAVVALFNSDVDDADVATLLGGTAPILALSLANDDELPGTFNNITTTGVNTIGGTVGISELGLANQPTALDISGLATLDLGAVDVAGLGLDLSGTEISAGLTTLENFTNLGILGLGEVGLDDAAFASVDWSQLASLEILFLAGNAITSLSPLAGANSGLLTLDVSGNPLAADLDVLDSFTNLQFLNLSATSIGDAGLAAIDWSAFTSLGLLALIDAGLTDINPLTTLTAPAGLVIFLFNNVLNLDAVCTVIPTLTAANYIVEQNIGVCGPLADVVIEGVGTVTPVPIPIRVANNTVINHFAQPVLDSGFAFEGWYDTTSGLPGDLITANPFLEFTVVDDVEITARFTNAGVSNLTVELDGASTGTGSVGGVPGFGTLSFLTGAEVFLIAQPDGGSFFGGWGGELSGFQFSQSLTLDSDKTVSALFVDSGFTVSIFNEIVGQVGTPEGTTAPSPGDYALAAGADFAITAFPTDAAWRFAFWQDNSTEPFFNIVDLQADTVVTAFFEEVPDRTLTMIIDGDGTTTPAGSPAPGTDYLFTDGAEVAISATPNAGQVFAGWIGPLPDGVSANQASFMLTMTADTELTAVFEAADTTLTIQTSGNGTTDPAPGEYGFLTSQLATVTAIPNDASAAFLNWTGDVDGGEENPTIFLLMDVDRTVTANFGDADHTLSLSVTGTGNINLPTGDSGWLDGQAIDLAVIPVSGNDAFVGWFDVTGGLPGDLLSSSTFYSFDITADISIEARFVTPEVTLTILNDTPERGFPLEGTFGYLTGDMVPLFAEPTPGNFFAGWTGDVVSGMPVITVEMDTDKTVTANFDTSGFNVVIAVSGNGSTQPFAGTYPVADGTEFTATAIETTLNWIFDGWTASGVTLGDPGDAEQTVTVDGADVTLTANFIEVVNPQLTIVVVGNGTTLPLPGTTVRTFNEEVPITATAGSGSGFIGWSGDIGASDPTATSISVLMNQDRTVTATFAEFDHTLTINVLGTGTTDPLPGAYGFFDGVSVNLEAIEINESGFFFDSWTGDIGGATATSAQISVIMDQDRTVTAVFIEGGEGEGEGEGDECEQGPFHSADTSENNQIELGELLRIIQFFNSGGFGCQEGTEDGYAPNNPDQSCCPHDSDYNPNFTASWTIDLTELLRLIQFFNSGGYNFCPLEETEDNYCPGL